MALVDNGSIKLSAVFWFMWVTMVNTQIYLSRVTSLGERQVC